MYNKAKERLSSFLTLVLLNPNLSVFRKHYMQTCGLLMEPSDQDPHCFPLCKCVLTTGILHVNRKKMGRSVVRKKYSTKQELTRVRSRWGAIANPHAKVFDSPAPRSPTPGHDLGNRM